MSPASPITEAVAATTSGVRSDASIGKQAAADVLLVGDLSVRTESRTLLPTGWRSTVVDHPLLTPPLRMQAVSISSRVEKAKPKVALRDALLVRPRRNLHGRLT